MNEIVILKAEIGAKYENTIYDYWLTIKLENEQTIEVFNYVYIENIEMYLLKRVKIELSTIFITQKEDKNLYSFIGKVVVLDNIWFFINDYIKIQVPITDDIKLNKLSTFYFGRIDVMKIDVIETRFNS